MVYNYYTITTMSRKRIKTEGALVIPLRVPVDMHARIRKLSDQARLSDADIMRMSIERGITRVEEMFRKPETQAA
jgi:predicted DNA-binding protein